MDPNLRRKRNLIRNTFTIIIAIMNIIDSIVHIASLVRLARVARIARLASIAHIARLARRARLFARPVSSLCLPESTNTKWECSALR